MQDLRHVTVYRDPGGRLNAAFPQVACLSTGDLVVAFRQAPLIEVGEGHDHGDPRARGVVIRSTDGGETWDPDTVRVLCEPEGGVEQISVSAISGDELLSPCAGRGDGRVTVRRSTDGGDTWDNPTAMGLWLSPATTHAPMLELPDGTLLSPHCGDVGRQHVKTVAASTDRGRTWAIRSIIAVDPTGRRLYHQASLVRYPDGEILAAMHSREKSADVDGNPVLLPRLWLSRSRDEGHTWSAPEELPCRISGAAHHILRLRDDRLLCTWGNRYDVSIRAAVSADRGYSWDTTRGHLLRETGHLPETESRHPAGRYARPGGPAVINLYSDGGEPGSVQLPDGRVLTVYYLANGAADPLRYVEAAIYSI